MDQMRQVLRGLSDVEGVIGSFVVSDDGGLVGTDLPATFDASVFAEAGPRLVHLADLGTTLGEEVRYFVLRFSEHRLYVRVLPGAFLAVLLSVEANVPALKAAAGLVARRVDALLEQHRRGAVLSDPPPVLDPAASFTRTLPSIAPIELPPLPVSEPPSAEVPSSGSAGPRRTVRFRGRSME